MSILARAKSALAVRREAPFPVDVVRALTAIEAQLGGRAEILGALALAEQTKAVRRIIGLLGDPDNDRRALAAICQDGDILPGDLLSAVSGGFLRGAHLQAMKAVAVGTPAIVSDIVRRAQPYEQACGECDGVGTQPPAPTKDDPNPGPTICPGCKGRGKLKYPADPACRSLAVDLAQLLPKSGPGLVINNTTQLGVGIQLNRGGGAGFERLQEAADRVLFASSPGAMPAPPDGVTLDAEVVLAPAAVAVAPEPEPVPRAAAPQPRPSAWSPPPGVKPDAAGAAGMDGADVA